MITSPWENFETSLCRGRIDPALLRIGRLSHSFFAGKTTLLLDLLDLCAQPDSQSLLHLRLSTGPIEVLHRLTLWRELNEAAGHSFAATAFGNKLLEQATLARVRPRGIAKVGADRGILKNRRRPPGGVGRASVASVLQEAQFEPEHIENVTIVLSHRAPQTGAKNARGGRETPFIWSRRFVMRVTLKWHIFPGRSVICPNFGRFPQCSV